MAKPMKGVNPFAKTAKTTTGKAPVKTAKTGKACATCGGTGKC